jgi:hypothetical protein
MIPTKTFTLLKNRKINTQIYIEEGGALAATGSAQTPTIIALIEKTV